MNKFRNACLIGLAATALLVIPAAAATNVGESKYCMASPMDPMCMSPKMFKMRMMMMSMTKAKVMANRSKYCREMAASADPICSPKMMHSTKGF